MSAWIVSERHINALVTAMVDRGLIGTDPEQLTATGRMLWRENHRSVNYRYDESTPTPRYTFERVELSAGSAFKQAHCYRYQTCEHPGWKRSQARKLTEGLIAKLEAEGYSTEHPAWQTEPWGV